MHRCVSSTSMLPRTCRDWRTAGAKIASDKAGAFGLQSTALPFMHQPFHLQHLHGALSTENPCEIVRDDDHAIRSVAQDMKGRRITPAVADDRGSFEAEDLQTVFRISPKGRDENIHIVFAAAESQRAEQ